MNKKYLMMFVVLFVIILFVGVFTIKRLKSKQSEESAVVEEEYVPEEEIAEEQMQTRNTTVTLYFWNSDSQKIMPEARVIDVKEIVDNPYQKLMELLIGGPQSEKMVGVIPEGTMVLGSSLEGGCLMLNVSSEILNFSKDDENAKENMITAIVDTMTELTEVNKVRIIVEGQPSDEFNREYERM